MSKDVLLSNRVDLVANIDIKHGILNILLEKGIINETHMERIEAKETMMEQREQLLDILKLRNKVCLDEFWNILWETKHEDLVKRCIPSFTYSGSSGNRRKQRGSSASAVQDAKKRDKSESGDDTDDGNNQSEGSESDSEPHRSKQRKRKSDIKAKKPKKKQKKDPEQEPSTSKEKTKKKQKKDPEQEPSTSKGKNAKKRKKSESEDEIDDGNSQSEGSEPPEIFISYKTDTNGNKAIEVLHRSLTGCGYSCWQDKEQIIGGDKINEKIEDGIRDCKIFLACLTTGYNDSNYCRNELNMALDEKKLVIPLMLEKNVPVPLRIKELKYIDCRESNNWKKPEDIKRFKELMEQLGLHVKQRKTTTEEEI